MPLNKALELLKSDYIDYINYLKSKLNFYWYNWNILKIVFEAWHERLKSFAHEKTKGRDSRLSWITIEADESIIRTHWWGTQVEG